MNVPLVVWIELIQYLDQRSICNVGLTDKMNNEIIKALNNRCDKCRNMDEMCIKLGCITCCRKICRHKIKPIGFYKRICRDCNNCFICNTKIESPIDILRCDNCLKVWCGKCVRSAHIMKWNFWSQANYVCLECCKKEDFRWELFCSCQYCDEKRSQEGVSHGSMVRRHFGIYE